MDSSDLTVDLFKEVFPQFPEGSKLFVGDNIPEAICDGWLEGLMEYVDTESKAPGGVYASSKGNVCLNEVQFAENPTKNGFKFA